MPDFRTVITATAVIRSENTEHQPAVRRSVQATHKQFVEETRLATSTELVVSYILLLSSSQSWSSS